LLSGLLHETTDPKALLDAAKTLLKPGGSLLVIVPNALSFHRLLAVEMGLIPTPTTLSPRNHALGQPVVFDRPSLEAIVRRSGLTDIRFSGYMFKPFSNDQIRQVVGILGAALVPGLVTLGGAFPEHAAEIAVSARKPIE
jgi:SAM-dependent methyltransferase